MRWMSGLMLLVGCAGPIHIPPTDTVEPHLGDDWFEWRAERLGISIDDARERDAAISVNKPPRDSLDGQTAMEAAVIWANLCARCHGFDGRMKGVAEADAMPDTKWGGVGVKMGFAFGADAMRAGIYESIAEGPNDPQSPMLAWKHNLSREQMWALVFYVEGF